MDETPMEFALLPEQAVERLRERHDLLVPGDESTHPDLGRYFVGAAGAVGLVEKAARDARKLAENDDLKPEAVERQQRDLLEAAERAAGEILDSRQHELERSLAEARDTLERASVVGAGESDAERLRDQMRSQEIRAELREMGAEARRRVLEQSIQAGSTEVLRALEGAFRPLVPPAVLEAARQRYAETKHPNVVARKEQLERAVEEMRGNRMNLGGYFRRLKTSALRHKPTN